MSAAAIATLSDSTGARIGIVIRASLASISEAGRPGPSPPSRMPQGACRSQWGRGVPPRGTVAKIRSPSARARCITSGSGCLAATGSLKVLPIAPRSAFQPNGSAQASPATTPVAPQASAARIMAPTLPGSCTSLRSSTSCGPRARTSATVAGDRLAIATTPEGRCTGLIAARTASGTTIALAPALCTRAASVVSRPCVRRSANATTSIDAPALTASSTRCSPSSSIHSWLPARASSRKRLTTGFWRLVMRSTDTILVLPFLTMKERLLRKFEEEIQQLDRELKTELPKEIKRARELGDLRENAEYQAAKERQRLVESRISMLQKRVSEISLMNLDRIPRDKVGFGSTVHLKDSGGQTIVYQLVMPEDADVEHGLISTASPIGRALLNKEEGDEVTVSAPNGNRNFEIVKLVTLHDD